MRLRATWGLAGFRRLAGAAVLPQAMWRRCKRICRASMPQRLCARDDANESLVLSSLPPLFFCFVYYCRNAKFTLPCGGRVIDARWTVPGMMTQDEYVAVHNQNNKSTFCRRAFASSALDPRSAKHDTGVGTARDTR